MNKAKLPDSLDLLLDTMCNTFGGIVFIAISLALTLCVCHNPLANTKTQKEIEEEIKKEQEIENVLLKEKNNLAATLANLKTHSSQHKDPDPDIYNAIIQLEMEIKNIKQNIEVITADLSLIEHKKEIAQNKKNEFIELIEEKKKAIEKKERLIQEREMLISQIKNLTEILQKKQVVSVHFTHLQRVTTYPYIILLSNNQMYQLGTDYYSSSEINVKKENNTLILTPISGTYISDISSENISMILNRYDKYNSFLFIIVHPDSFEKFVELRRILREKNYYVYWYIEDKFTLPLVNDAKYQAGR